MVSFPNKSMSPRGGDEDEEDIQSYREFQCKICIFCSLKDFLPSNMETLCPVSFTQRLNSSLKFGG
jgi:hypothetical protein